MEQVWAALIAVIPSVGVGVLFYKIIKTIVEGDRNERLAHSRWEAQQKERAATHSVPPDTDAERDAP